MPTKLRARESTPTRIPVWTNSLGEICFEFRDTIRCYEFVLDKKQAGWIADDLDVILDRDRMKRLREKEGRRC